MGLSNSGKSSILYYLQGIRNLPAYSEVKPTIQINRVIYQAVDYDHTIWDFGGQESYISQYLEQFSDHLIGVNGIIYVIDIQDKEKYQAALNYLQKIIEILQSNNHQIEISVFLHKYDPDLKSIHAEITESEINELIKKIKTLFSKNMRYNISKTTIYAEFKEYTVK